MNGFSVFIPQNIEVLYSFLSNPYYKLVQVQLIRSKDISLP